jgi:hypothetical protein
VRQPKQLASVKENCLVIDFSLLTPLEADHKFHFASTLCERLASRIFFCDSSSSALSSTIKQTFIARRSLLQALPTPKADNRWHNKCNKSTQSAKPFLPERRGGAGRTFYSPSKHSTKAEDDFCLRTMPRSTAFP